MHAIAQLKQLREQMLEELTQIPQYRALKAIERFIGEISTIYDDPPTPEAKEKELKPPFPPQAPKKSSGEPASAPAPKVTPYLPTHRVA